MLTVRMMEMMVKVSLLTYSGGVKKLSNISVKPLTKNKFFYILFV